MREQVLEAIEHQELPFAALVEALGAPRDPSRNPLFQVAFSMRPRDIVDLDLAGVDVRPVAAPIAQAKFDLTLTLVEWPDSRGKLVVCVPTSSGAERSNRSVDGTRRWSGDGRTRRGRATLPLMDEATLYRERVSDVNTIASASRTGAATLTPGRSKRSATPPRRRGQPAGSGTAGAGCAAGAIVAVARRRARTSPSRGSPC
jgi:hypothetical protein